MNAIRGFLDSATLDKGTVDRFLDPKEPNWATFDPEVGYTLRNSIVRDGLDDSYTIGRYAEGRPPGMRERLLINYADRKCRINTYGNSFTMCHQVSDGETWQEYLAAHLGEPIRNFGVGGYGVYQAYRRMIRTEKTDLGTPYVILNIWGIDDHLRSIDSWRGLRCLEWLRDPRHATMFHSNPWVHVRIDPETGALVELENLCPTPESLYRLCDKEFVYEHFKNDIALQMFLGQRPGVDVNTGPMKKLAETLGVKADFDSDANRCRAIAELYRAYGLRASMHIIDKAQAFVENAGKKLMVLLSFQDNHVADECADRPRPDQPFVDFLTERKILFVDILRKHKDDYAVFKLTPDEYIRRYFIGHYSPKGNHFFAFAIKDDIVNWLDPKPLTYRAGGSAIRFDNYLQSP
jgi:hypothetical protein